MESQLYDTIPKRAVPKRAEYGNSDGLEHMNDTRDDIKQLKADVEKLKGGGGKVKEDVEKLKRDNKLLGTLKRDLLIVRHAVLEDWRSGDPARRSREVTMSRNAIAHGGDVIADVEYIRSEMKTNNTTWSRYLETFKLHYGLTFLEAEDLVRTEGGEEIFRILNEGVNLDVLDRYQAQSKAAEREEGKALCSAMISMFMRTAPQERRALFAAGGELREKYRRIQQLTDVVR